MFLHCVRKLEESSGTHRDHVNSTRTHTQPEGRNQTMYTTLFIPFSPSHLFYIGDKGPSHFQFLLQFHQLHNKQQQNAMGLIQLAERPSLKG